MSTNLDYVQFVCDQIPSQFERRYKKMFGECMIYVDECPILLLCNNTVYVKILPELLPFLKDAKKDIPYQNAKEHYILDIENTELLEYIFPILIKEYVVRKKL